VPRHKEFDPDQALEKAMQVFWRQGYEATSVDDLVKHMGINRFSLYDTFGDKHQLFLAALDRYRQRVMGERLQVLERSQEGLGAIRRHFEGIAEAACSQAGRLGCLMTNSTVELAPDDKDAAAKIRFTLKGIEEAFYEALQRARRKREIPKSKNLRDLARFLTNSAQGLAVLAKARPARPQLESIVRTTLAALKKS
jgi:TetR/AcrR family transcriptional repressor of nem operon